MSRAFPQQDCSGQHCGIIDEGVPPVLATTQSCAVVGLDGYIVQVEVDISPGLPAFKMVGTQSRQLTGPVALQVEAQSQEARRGRQAGEQR
jgi:hypothetical protein